MVGVIGSKVVSVGWIARRIQDREDDGKKSAARYEDLPEIATEE